VRLQFVCPPDALHRTHRDANRVGHRPAGPVGRSSTPPPVPWFLPGSAPCQACGSCRATDLQPRSRQSAVAIAIPSAG
jgi:hypothetical protein